MLSDYRKLGIVGGLLLDGAKSVTRLTALVCSMWWKMGKNKQPANEWKSTAPVTAGDAATKASQIFMLTDEAQRLVTRLKEIKSEVKELGGGIQIRCDEWSDYTRDGTRAFTVHSEQIIR